MYARPNGQQLSAPTRGSSNASSPSPSNTSLGSNDIEAARTIAKSHFNELANYLSGVQVSAKAGSSKDKLTRLTRQQFSELTKDVYDELVRRKVADTSPDSQPEPFLLSQPTFHPKRNQARQKLATLPTSRFKDLASDVFFELERRYPEFKEELQAAQQYTPQQYTSQPPLSSQPRTQTSPQKRPTSPPITSANVGQLQAKQPSLSKTLERATANEVLIPNKSTLVEEDVSRPGSAGSNRHARNRSDAPSLNSLRMNGHDRMAQHSNQLPNLTEDFDDTASSDRMEDLRPFAQSSRGMGGGGRTSEGSSVAAGLVKGYASGTSSYTGGIQNMMSGLTSPTSPAPPSMPSNASQNAALAAKNKDLQDAYDAVQKAQDELRNAKSDSQNRILDLEQQIDDLQQDLTAEQADKKRLNDKLRDLEQDLKGQMRRNQEQTDQLNSFQQEYNELNDRHQQTLEDANQARETHSQASQRAQNDVRRLQDAVANSERALTQAQTKRSPNNSTAVADLKGEAANLLAELKTLNGQYEQLSQDREVETEKAVAAQKETEMWRERYQRAKTELRAIKATSQLIVQPSQITEAVDQDYMPVTAQGGLADVHITAFQSSIDVLLVTGRSEAPSSVLKATNAVVMAITKIDEDVQSFESAGRTQELPSTDRDRLQALKARTHSTLSNLITASKNHAAARGFSPVSLLDAAASHLSITIVDMIKILKVRKAVESEIAALQREQQIDGQSDSEDGLEANGVWSQRNNYPTQQVTPPKAGLRSEPTSVSRPTPIANRPFVSRTDSSSQLSNSPSVQSLSKAPVLNYRPFTKVESPTKSLRNGVGHSPQSSYGDEPPIQPLSNRNGNRPVSPEQQRVLNSANSSDRRTESPVLLDTSLDSNEDDLSPMTHGISYDREQFRLYLENQTENIVQAIQSLLTAIRGGRQGQDLLADLNTISGLVIGIVDATRDNLPSQSQDQAKEIRADLKSNYRKLDELQNSIAQGTFDKQVKSSLAAASFAIARSLKQLNLMFAEQDVEDD